MPSLVTRHHLATLLVCSASFGVVALRASPSAVAAQSRPPVTFNRDVAPIIYANCSSCHRPGESAPFSLLSYDDVKQRGRLIASVTEHHVMPPWQPESSEGEFTGERRLDPLEIATLMRWVDEGMAEGDPNHRPAPPAFTSGWQLGRPDIVISMPDVVAVPADGPDVFRNFVLPIPISDRRYVRAFEFRPGNARVLHHARILLDDSGDVRLLDARDAEPGFGGMDVPGARFPDGHFLGWAPGTAPVKEAFPWPVEPGTDFVVQMHLKPSGRPELLQASIGLYLTDGAPARTPIMLRLGSKTIDIPADEPAYEVTDSFELPADVRVLGISAHAHYLATEMRVVAKAPNGEVDTLLRIPNWNFNWQDQYQYSEPVELTRGTTIEMRYRYDNTADNPHNPSTPPRRVVFGSQTVDEMGELLVQVLPTNPEGAAKLRADVARKNLLTDVAGEEKRVADLPGDFENRNALGVAYIQLGRPADAVAQFEAALALAPEHAATHYNLGVVAMGEQRVADAVTRFQRALASRPAYAEAHNNLGVAFERLGRLREAEQQYREALAARPSNAAAHNNLARMLLNRDEVPDAIVHFRAALRTQPENADALFHLGRALLANRKSSDAVATWRRALAARPESVPIMINLAWLLSTHPDERDAGEAVKLSERANKLTGNSNPFVLDVMAAAYAASDWFDLAVRTAQRALQRATAVKDDDLASAIRQRLDAYSQMNSGGNDGFPRIP